MRNLDFIQEVKVGDLITVNDLEGTVISIQPQPNNGTKICVKIALSVVVLTPAMSLATFEIKGDGGA